MPPRTVSGPRWLRALRRRAIALCSAASIVATSLGAPAFAADAQLGPAPRLELPPDVAESEARAEAVPPAAGLSVDTADRAAVVAFFNANYRPFDTAAIGWTGDYGTCAAGTTSQAYADATLGRVNYFRAMAGLPGTVTLDDGLNGKDQSAALMMSAQGVLSHMPPASFACFTAAGAEAASNSNLALGVSGPAAITLYMDDPGAGNGFAGHRRWVLFPPQVTMGTGSVPATSGRAGSNALWVLAPFGPRPPGPDGIAWPPRGFVPYQVMPISSSRWSFSYPGADFSAAGVAMSRGGAAISAAPEPQATGFGDNTLVWRPVGVGNGRPASDTTYSVRVSGVRIGGVPRDFVYDVTVIDPDAMPVATIFSAVLPGSRSVMVGAAATVFATIANAGAAAVSGCGIGLATDVPATLAYQATDPATNAVVGTPNTPVAIAPGGTQSFLVALTPTAAIAPTDVVLAFACAGGAAPTVAGLNTVLLSASATAVPDVVALVATATHDGIMAIPGSAGSGAFAVATANIGASGVIDASVDTGGVALPLQVAICRTNPVTGACQSAIGPRVTLTIGAGEMPTFGIFVTATGPMPLDPAGRRVFVRFTEGGVTRGAASVAVRTD